MLTEGACFVAHFWGIRLTTTLRSMITLGYTFKELRFPCHSSKASFSLYKSRAGLRDWKEHWKLDKGATSQGRSMVVGIFLPHHLEKTCGVQVKPKATARKKNRSLILLARCMNHSDITDESITKNTRYKKKKKNLGGSCLFPLPARTRVVLFTLMKCF